MNNTKYEKVDDFDSIGTQLSTFNTNGNTQSMIQQDEVVTPQAASFISVIAPQDMREGTVFISNVSNIGSFEVTVPQGGIERGQSINVDLRNLKMVIHKEAFANAAASLDQIPVGRFRDGLCACCSWGPCHIKCCSVSLIAA